MTRPISGLSSVQTTFDNMRPLKSEELATYSTLTTMQCEANSTPLSWRPFIFIKSLFSKVWSIIIGFFQWCLGSSREEADFWKRAKKEFGDIHTDTCLLKSSPNLKQYIDNVRHLSEDVKEGYKQHLLAAHVAAVYPEKSSTQQQEWVKVNISTFKFDAYFNMDKSNQVIVNAVENYWKEIEVNQPQKAK